MRTSRLFRAIPFLFIMVLCPIARGNDIYIDDDGPGDFDNIQAGIDAAEYGDTVSVAPGTYCENIRLKDGVNLLGAGARVTIIDAQGYGDVVDARANHSTVAGFTLRNSGENDLWHTNCGVYMDGSYSPVITDNVIAGNKIGIGVWDGAHPDIRNNIILNNSLGLYIYGSKDSPSDPDIINNTIVNNEMDGIALRVMVSPVIVNNIIVGNMTGIDHNFVTGTPCLSYNNLWANDVNYLRDNEVDETLAGPGSISVDPYFAAPGYWADANDPNIGIAEPNDSNAVWIDGDYHLKSQAGRYNPNTQAWIVDDVTSPCIDAGDPNSPIGEEPEPNGGIINIGAYGGTKEAGKSPSGLQARYSGGTGEPNDPYQIATAADLIALGETPEDYDKHFILTNDIDLDPNLPGRKVFDKAVIGTFRGVFDGDGHTISHLATTGGGSAGLFGQLGSGAEVKDLGVVDVNIAGAGSFLGGLVGENRGTVARCYSTGSVKGTGPLTSCLGGLVGRIQGGVLVDCYSTACVDGGNYVGGLVGGMVNGSVTRCHSTGTVNGSGYSVGALTGENLGGLVAQCYSSGSVSGGRDVGGLVGWNYGDGRILNSYSTAAVTGINDVGGLVGWNESNVFAKGHVTNSYSVGAVSGSSNVGGLVGYNIDGYGSRGEVIACFWDTQTSGETTSAGGTGKTTAEMQTASTFLDAGWDFVGETANGTEEIWWVLEGQDCPRLWWELITGETSENIVE